jgi:hypothetical protein
MKTGFSELRALRKKDRRMLLETAFLEAFPKCAFKSKTVYKHIKYYDAAVELNIISTFSGVGQAPSGKWSDLVKAVEDARRTSVNTGECSSIHHPEYTHKYSTRSDGH